MRGETSKSMQLFIYKNKKKEKPITLKSNHRKDMLCFPSHLFQILIYTTSEFSTISDLLIKNHSYFDAPIYL